MRLLSMITTLTLFSTLAHAGLGFYPTRFQIFKAASNQHRIAPMSSKLQYYGGPVLSNARVATVIWGEGVDTAVEQGIGGMYAATVNSTHMEWLNQYATFATAIDGRAGTNQNIARGSYIGDFKITPANKSKKLDDLDIRAEIEHQVALHVLPAPDANTLFMIHFPAGINISVEGAQSCSSFCAYHNGFQSQTLGPVFYGVMPDFTHGACSFGCGMDSNAFNTATEISSHELIEAISDPFPTPGSNPAYPQAWNTTDGEEIADLCASGISTLNTPNKTYKLSAEWDNKTNSCYSGTFESK